jgi:Mg-chelatase subunit ChlD
MKRAQMRKRFSAIALKSIATFALQLAIISDASVLNLRIFMNEMEFMALSVAREVENIYADRCNRLSSCVSFHECKSAFDEATKECRTDYVADCRNVEGSGCGKTYDFSQTNVRIPSQLLNAQTSQPEDAHLKEDICYSNTMTETFRSAAIDLQKTSDKILQPPQTFFGTSNGMFRIWPAQHSEVCGIMDTRIRPWFVAASSGPKDVVILIDRSGSMAGLNRWNLAINAAKSVINTLTIGDHFNVVLFNNIAETLGFPTLVRATAENKETVLRALEESSYGGLTNFEAAFDKAYDLFQSSKTTEISSNCHRAILFLSDGEPTIGKTGTGLCTNIAEKNTFNATIFSYALGESADKESLKNIACTSGGIYANIPDGGDLVQQMSAYYKLYAILQGGSENMNFTTWVEPYLYSSGVMGTTVSTPVFDRSKDTPLWIGVVGVDFTISELEQAVGGTDSYQAVLDELVAVSTATCPETNFEKQACLIEALRRDDSSEGGICGSPGSSSCSFQTVTPSLCSGASFPSMFWENALVSDTQDYISRGCCTGTGRCTSASGAILSAGCNKDWCTSPDSIGGYDCWAGSSVEPCTCSTGKAKETGESVEYMGQTYYEYICCTDGSGAGEQCGEFKESDEVNSTIIIIIVFVIGLGVGICACVRCCQRNGGCCQPKGIYYSGELRSHIQQPIPASVDIAQQTQEVDSTMDGDLVPVLYKTPSNYYR